MDWEIIIIKKRKRRCEIVVCVLMHSRTIGFDLLLQIFAALNGRRIPQTERQVVNVRKEIDERLTGHLSTG